MRAGGLWALSKSLKKFFDKQMISSWILIFNLKIYFYVLQNLHLRYKQISLRLDGNLDEIHYKKIKTF